MHFQHHGVSMDAMSSALDINTSSPFSYPQPHALDGLEIPSSFPITALTEQTRI